MLPHLPNLNGLRAFLAAAHHQSFKKAAEALYVTPGAVSQHVKALEEELGLPLFHRYNRAVALTDAGRRLLPVVREAFQAIATTVEELHQHDRAGPLTVSVLPSFAAKWLVPRLARFREAHPEIDVRISATHTVADFTREDVDVAIRLGSGNYPGLHSVHMLTEEMYPVCSPRLLAGAHPLRAPEDLRFHTLLHDETPNDWRRWLKAHGVVDINPERGPTFNDAAMVLQTAIEGHGVAMTRSALAEADLAAGRLVRPFGESVPSGMAYYVVCPEAAAHRPKIAAFRDWLLHEASRERAESAMGPGEAAPSGDYPG